MSHFFSFPKGFMAVQGLIEAAAAAAAAAGTARPIKPVAAAAAEMSRA